jgi:hypothetical protein
VTGNLPVTDLIISEVEGWYELDDFLEAVRDGAIDVHALWDLVAEGRHEEALELLEAAGYDELPGEGGRVRMLAEPEPMIGERWRVWTADAPVDEE